MLLTINQIFLLLVLLSTSLIKKGLKVAHPSRRCFFNNQLPFNVKLKSLETLKDFGLSSHVKMVLPI